MQDREAPAFDYLVVRKTPKGIIETLRLTAILMDKSAGAAWNLEVFADPIFADEEKLLAFRVQALETFEDDIAHAAHVSGTHLIALLHPGIWGAAGHATRG